MKKLTINRSLKSALGVLISAVLCFAQQVKTPQDYGAANVNLKDINLSQKKSLVSLSKKAVEQSPLSENSTLAGQTFKAVAFNEERGIDRFTKQSANVFLERDLFSAPEYTATYYNARYDKNSLIIENTYIQLVSDSYWDRILYGSLQGVLKSYNDIKSPGEIAVNASGQVFVAEAAQSRIQILQIKGTGESIQLVFADAIENVGHVSSLAYNDGGTPFDLTDDYIFVADAAANIVTRINFSAGSWTKGKQYKGFQWPSAITFGRWNGAHTNELYMIDSYRKKLSLLQEEGEDLTLVRKINANAVQNFSSVEIDHFGQVYLADGVNSELYKYSADLQLLASEKAMENGIMDINIPFGTIDLNGTKYWTGFDQAFIIQKWDEMSGIQRYKLGVALTGFNVAVADYNKSLQTDYNTTEFANSRVQLKNSDGNVVYQSPKQTTPSGQNSLIWDRINANGQQTAPGYYEMKLEIQSLYDESIISQKAAFYLPLYYHIDCGVEDDTPAIRKISGTDIVAGGYTVSRSNEKVEYMVTGLSPDSEYKVAARFINDAGESAELEMYIDGIGLDQLFESNQTEYESGFIDVPKEAFLDGEINIRVSRSGPGTVNVADIWITESGREFSFSDPAQAMPEKYKLSQNYPNPFNPSTTIAYQLLSNSAVILKVYDVTGREIKTLVDSYQNAGRHHVVFNADNLSSGIYFYKLTTETYSETKKMVLLK